MNDIISEQHTESQQMGLRERKKRLAQAAIEEASLTLFQQRGYEQTSIRDIADAVMMSPRTFFRYFTSKEDILFALTHLVLEDAVRYLQQISAANSTLAALNATFMHLAGLYQQQREHFLTRYHIAVVTPALAPTYVYSLAATEQALCKALSARPETEANEKHLRFLVALYMAAFRVTLEEWLENEAQDNLIPLLQEHLDRLAPLF